MSAEPHNVLARPAAPPEPEDLLAARLGDSLMLRGDISQMSPGDRARYYVAVCKSLGLNPYTTPLLPLKLNGREILYATRGTTDQLSARAKLTREIVEGPEVKDLWGTKVIYCKCRATHPDGRVETSIATLPLSDPTMILMKLETKAKRRVTLSILGLGLLDESEIADIPRHELTPGEPIELEGGVVVRSQLPAPAPRAEKYTPREGVPAAQPAPAPTEAHHAPAAEPQPAPPPVDWAKKIERAAASKKPGAALVAIAKELTAATPQPPAAVAMWSVAFAKVVARVPDKATLDAAAAQATALGALQLSDEDAARLEQAFTTRAQELGLQVQPQAEPGAEA